MDETQLIAPEKIIISSATSKGGCGKSVLTHYSSTGFGLRGFRVIHVNADNSRPILNDKGRPYRTFSGKTSDELKKIIVNFHEYKDIAEIDKVTGEIVKKPPFIMHIENGAGKLELDEWIVRIGEKSGIQSVNIIPVQNSYEDFYMALQDIERLPNSVLVKNSWPTEYLVIPNADAEFDKAFINYKDKVLDYKVERSSNLRLITHPDKYDLLTSETKAKSRTFAGHLLNWIKEHPVSFT